jgi:hypothetical protein
MITKVKNVKVGWPTGHPHQLMTYLSPDKYEVDNDKFYESIVTAILPRIVDYLVKADLTYKDVYIISFEYDY